MSGHLVVGEPRSQELYSGVGVRRVWPLSEIAASGRLTKIDEARVREWDRRIVEKPEWTLPLDLACEYRSVCQHYGVSVNQWYCQLDEVGGAFGRWIGYDVVSLSFDFSLIHDDLVDDMWGFSKRLNHCGLFDTYGDAAAFVERHESERNGSSALESAAGLVIAGFWLG